MFNEEFEKQYKDYFDDFGERGFSLAWLYTSFKSMSDINTVLQAHQINSPSKNMFLPDSDTIKNEVIQHIRNQPDPKNTLEFIHLFIKNMLIDSDFLESIDNNNCALISYLIINILREQNPQQDNSHLPENYVNKPPLNSSIQIINIPESNKYESLNKNINIGDKNIKIPRINHKSTIKQSEDLFGIFVFLIDQYQSTLENKKIYISSLLNSFDEIKNNKSTYKWIDPDNTDQTEWILNHLTTIRKTKIFIEPIFYIETYI